MWNNFQGSEVQTETVGSALEADFNDVSTFLMNCCGSYRNFNVGGKKNG